MTGYGKNSLLKSPECLCLNLGSYTCIYTQMSIRMAQLRGIPDSLVVKNPSADGGDTGWNLVLGRFHMLRSN